MFGAHNAGLVDTHCHLDLYADLASAVRDAQTAGVLTIAVTNTPSVFSHLLGIVGTTTTIRVALGLHPELAHERYSELPLFRTLMARTRFIGEIGLDYVTSDQSRRRRQLEVLTAIVGWCSDAGDKVATVHSRRAAEDLVDVFQGFRGTYILHWYTGSLRTLSRALSNGAYVSVNPAMVRSERTMALIAKVPQERVLTETDGPFVSVGNRPATPSDVVLALRGLSSLWNVEADVARDIVHQNFTRIMQLPSVAPGA